MKQITLADLHQSVMLKEDVTKDTPKFSQRFP